ncbi:MAG TPA: hypothetical protein VFQ22_05505, partial [Longimicrobiales bacterium]|nr:hypothetical protein [Longimicrobiales bacterium]
MTVDPPRRPIALALAFAAACALAPAAALGQEPGLKLAVGDVGLGFGDVPRLDGLRFNYRDRRLERVRGLNLTLWTPYEDARGTVEGLALGLPMTGAETIRGIGVGLGLAANRELSGIGIAPVGLGAGGDLRGVFVGGLGAGAGADVRGV